MIFSLGITITIKMQHLGIHPWEVLNVAMYEKVGFSIGTWSIIFSIILVIISFVLDRRYVKLGTYVNAFIVGLFVDFYLWADFLPNASNTWTDIIIIIIGIVIMGIGGGMYNAAGVGSGPRDGFMLSISDKTGMTIRRVRITTESLVLVIGLVIGGPVFVFTFIFTFIQSPIFQHSYTFFRNVITRMDNVFGFNNKIKEQNS
ncbi:YczE/YyaS/YitT family protein [Oceanobacillus sp. CAU 1775]